MHQGRLNAYWLPLAVLTCILGGCPSSSPSTEVKEFLEKPLEEMYEAFSAFSPERQVEAYLAAQMLHPPLTSFCEELGKNSGAAAIDPLLRALKTETGNYRKVALLKGLSCVTNEVPDACTDRVLAEARGAAASVRGRNHKLEADRAVSYFPCSEGRAR